MLNISFGCCRHSVFNTSVQLTEGRSARDQPKQLLVYDPSLKLMVVTKENVAAHAIVEHLVALQLLQEVQQLMGRLVRYYEQRRKGSGTPLDLPVENRNHHIRQKSLLIRCGSGFLMECGQPYSPVSETWRRLQQ